MAFRFREFAVEDDHSTQRVGTDAVLLGAWAQPGNSLRILEIGTGCGVIALMLAGKCTGRIEAIDADAASIGDAEANFRRSPWNERLHAIHADLLHFRKTFTGAYDFILTNPPFFKNSLLSPQSGKNQARHMNSLSWPSLFESVSGLLEPSGKFALIAPFEEYSAVSGAALSHLLFIQRLTEVHSVTGKPSFRILVEFAKTPPERILKDQMDIITPEGSRSEAFAELTRPYYLTPG